MGFQHAGMVSSYLIPVLWDDALVAESRKVLEGLHKRWVRKIVESVNAMAEHLPPDENYDLVKLVLGVS
jgi:hypothetical protein